MHAVFKILQKIIYITVETMALVPNVLNNLVPFVPPQMGTLLAMLVVPFSKL